MIHSVRGGLENAKEDDQGRGGNPCRHHIREFVACVASLSLVWGYVHLPKQLALVYLISYYCTLILVDTIGTIGTLAPVSLVVEPRALAPPKDWLEVRRRKEGELARRCLYERVTRIKEDPTCMRRVRDTVQDYGRGAYPGGAVKWVACEEVDTAVDENEDEDEDKDKRC